MSTSVKKPKKTVRIVEIEIDHNEVTSNTIEEFEIAQNVGEKMVSQVSINRPIQHQE
jgi:hypothetical protein